MPETDSTLSTATRSAHVVQSGVWFYVVGRDGGYVRAADGDEDDRLVSYSLREDAQAHADCLNAASTLEQIANIYSDGVCTPGGRRFA